MGARDDASHWERVKAVFSEAAELAPAERAAFLAAATAGDDELRREVESLLAQHEREGGLMSSPTLWASGPADGQAGRPGSSALPEHFGRYRIEARLGAGGMGEVYRAHDQELDRTVAVKVLPSDLASHPGRRVRLLQEARAAARLIHPHIPAIHEIGVVEGRDYIALEYVPGRSLAALLAERALAPDELLALALPLAQALAFAHEHGVIHRDVKAANVMVSDGGQPKLVDFGLAQLHSPLDGEQARAATQPPGAIFGTPGAMSPEQALGQEVDQRTDVFSFGSLLYEMAARRPAFRAETSMGTMDAVVRQQPVPLASLRPDLPAGLLTIVDTALRKDPGRRYQRMADLAADLAALQRSTQSGLQPAAVPLAALRRKRAAVTGGAALLVLLAWWALAGGDNAPSGPPPTLAVMGFDNLDDPDDADRLATMLARRLTSELSHADGLAMLSQQRIFDVARQLGREDGTIDRTVATDVARRAGVEIMILGELGRSGSSLVATIEVVALEDGRVLDSHEARGERPEDVFAMAESLGRQVRASLSTPDSTPEERAALASQLTTSLAAYRAFVEGEQALQHNDLRPAAAAFRRATELDPAFALAHYRLAMALVWLQDFDAVQRALERAFAFRDNLPADLRRILDATRPMAFEDETRDALPFLLEVVAEDPFQRDALYMLGEIYTHSGTRNDSAQAAAVYERLLALDPGFSLVYEHLLSADLRRGQRDRAWQRLAGWRLHAPDQVPELEGQLLLWESRIDEARALLGSRLELELLAGERGAPALATALLQNTPGILAELAETRGVERVLALDLRACALAAYGRFTTASELLRHAIAVEIIVSSDGYATNTRNASRHRLADLALLLGDATEARRLADEALVLQPDSFRCLYQATRFALAAGDTSAARQHVALLDELATRGWSPTASLYRDGARAELDLAEGRAETARPTLAALVASGRLLEDCRAFGDSAGPLLRSSLARACLALGDEAGAAAALDGLLASGIERLRQPLAFVAALEQRGRVELSQGRLDEGRARLARFLEHWGSPDAELAAVLAARRDLDD